MAQDYAKGFYNSPAWRRCQKGFMQSRNYICERCGSLACLAHHIKHITPLNINDPKITMSWSNLMALCQDCHAVVHGGQACAEGISFNDKGQLIYTPPRVNEKTRPAVTGHAPFETSP